MVYAFGYALRRDLRHKLRDRRVEYLRRDAALRGNGHGGKAQGERVMPRGVRQVETTSPIRGGMGDAKTRQAGCRQLEGKFSWACSREFCAGQRCETALRRV